MIVYRISTEEFKDDISGNGAAINGSRWNSIGVRLLYSSQYISLCILESLVHLKYNYLPTSHYLLKILLPEEEQNYELPLKIIRDNWQQDFVFTQWMGDQFITTNQSLVLKVPSAIVPQEHNFLVNPLHKDFKKIKIISSELLNLDKRLLQT